MFSIFKKQKIDTSNPLNFKNSIVKNNVSTSELFEPSIFQSWAKKENARDYMIVLEDLAVGGNKASQEFLAQFSIMTADGMKNETAQHAMRYKSLKFSVLAAESGSVIEAMNIPITAAKVLSVLIKKNGGLMDEEVKSLVSLSYKWQINNSRNLNIDPSERKRFAAEALKLVESWPQLKNEDSTTEDSLIDEKFIIIALNICTILGSDAPLASDANLMAKEVLNDFSKEKIEKGNPEILAVYVLMMAATSALADNEKNTAKMISRKCKINIEKITSISNRNYNDLDFSLIDESVEAMKKIDL